MLPQSFSMEQRKTGMTKLKRLPFQHSPALEKKQAQQELRDHLALCLEAGYWARMSGVPLSWRLVWLLQQVLKHSSKRSNQMSHSLTVALAWNVLSTPLGHL